MSKSRRTSRSQGRRKGHDDGVRLKVMQARKRRRDMKRGRDGGRSMRVTNAGNKREREKEGSGRKEGNHACDEERYRGKRRGREGSSTEENEVNWTAKRGER